MILYTPVPQELIWEGWDKPPDYFWATIAGRTVQLEKSDHATARIVRMYSTDPFDYLDPAFFPGREVALGGEK